MKRRKAGGGTVAYDIWDEGNETRRSDFSGIYCKEVEKGRNCAGVWGEELGEREGGGG